MLKLQNKGENRADFSERFVSNDFPLLFCLVISTFVDLLLVTFYLILSAALTSFSS